MFFNKFLFKTAIPIRYILLLSFITFTFSCEQNSDPFSSGRYIDRVRAERSDNKQIEDEIDSLLSIMTLEEKAGQMLHINLSQKSPFDTIGLDQNYNTERLIDIAEKYGIGFAIGDMGFTSGQWTELMPQLLKLYREHTRLNIPFLYSTCHQHGPTYVRDGTIFPHNLNIAATFDTTHAYNSGYVTSLETAHLGHNFIYVPVVDLGRNPRWPRFYETFGESYLICSAMGGSIVHGIQNDKETMPFKAASCAKHFLGYSDPKHGWDRVPAHIPDQELYEFFVPSFQACIDAGVKIVEANSGEVNGIPAHASYELLTTLLRDKMNFTGVLNSDWADVKKLVDFHGVAENEKEATFMGLNAGLDCVLTTNDYLFAKYACELVQEGRIPEERIDLSVRRILRLKYDLGLFNKDISIKAELNERVGRTESRKKALDAARESLVLLKNENDLLPLDQGEIKKIVVAGPNADSKSAIAGGWTVSWSDVKDEQIPEEVITVYEGIRNQFKKSLVELATHGAEIENKSHGADVIVYVAGERPYAEFLGSINDLNLPDQQIQELGTAIKTNVPVIAVMVAGRPRIISKVYDDLEGFIWAGLPGYQGGIAVSELLCGALNPSGKLPFEYPLGASSYMNYNRKKFEQAMIEEIELEVSMAAFGDGLSYTSFRYENLSLSDTVITGNDRSIVATVEVTNTGNRDGKESVLWYITDEVGSITRPVKELKRFEKKDFEPDEIRTFQFEIYPLKHLSYPDDVGNPILENGFFTLRVGSESYRFRYKNS